MTKKNPIYEIDFQDIKELETQALKDNGYREILPYLKSLILELQGISKDVAIIEWSDDKKAIHNVVRTLLQHEKNTKVVRDWLKRYRNLL